MANDDYMMFTLSKKVRKKKAVVLFFQFVSSFFRHSSLRCWYEKTEEMELEDNPNLPTIYDQTTKHNYILYGEFMTTKVLVCAFIKIVCACLVCALS